MTSAAVQIFSGDKVSEELGRKELERMSEAWAEHQLGPMREQTRGERLREFIGMSSTHSTQRAERHQAVLGLADHLQEAMTAGNMVIAKRGEKVIGMIRVRPIENVGPNSPVRGQLFELGKAYVDPTERGAGVYSEMREQLVQHIVDQYPDAYIITGTKHDKVKVKNREDGWEEIGYDNYLRVLAQPEDDIQMDHDYHIKEGWTAFLRHPQPKQTGDYGT
jgi:predicted GNAT family N-acyltransferase